MTPTKKQAKDFESALGRLEEITTALESGDVALEESIELYTEGVELAKLCEKKLGEAEKKVKIIVRENGVDAETDFESGEEN